MANRARRHHVIPSFYLAGFTASGLKDGCLYVFDQGQISSWQSTPMKAGHRRDFYAVDLGPDVDPACFESDVLAPLETEFSRVVRTLVETKKLPEGDDFNVLLNFIAVMATRTPRIRRLVSRVTDMVMKYVVQSQVATDEGWQQFCDCCRRAGGDLDVAQDQEMRKFIAGGEYTIDLDRTSHVQKIVELVEGTLALLAQRRWSLAIAAPGTPDFVCSDAPVKMVPTAAFGEQDQLHLANPHTLVAMPLTRRTLLWGCYEESPPVVQVNEFCVLSINAITITEAKQVFSPEEDFVYLGSDKRARRRSDLIEFLRARNGKYSHLDEAVEDWFHKRFMRPGETKG